MQTHAHLHTFTHTPKFLNGRVLPPKKRQTQDPNPETHKSVRCSWTLWQIYLGQIVSEKLPLELPWTKLAVGESKSHCMRVGDNGGRMCWCAAGGWGGTMDGLVSPLADWFEMAPLSLSPWGVPLSRFWFPLLTNSKQKSISFSRGGKISTRVSAGESDSKTYLQEMADSLTPTLYVFFLSSAFILFICSLYCPVVVLGSGMLNDPGFSDLSGAGAPVGGLEAALRSGSLILKYTEMPSQAGLKSVWCRPWVPSLDGPLLSVTLEEPSFLFFCLLFLFFPSLKRLVNKLWQLSRGA